MSIFDKLRRWVDGEESSDALEKAVENTPNRGAAQEFIIYIAREIETVMQAEMVSLPHGEVLIPTEYTVFLSDDDDREWQGAKRRGMEQGLYHILGERARELSGKNKLAVKSFSVEMRVDGTLNKGEVRVQHSWDETGGGKTSVLPRRPIPTPAAPVLKSSSAAAVPHFEQTPPNFAPVNQQLPATQAFQPNELIAPPENEAATVVRRRLPELYRLEIWREGVRQSVLPVLKTELTVGRGSESVPVDVPLKGDPEISRHHFTIQAADGIFRIITKGKNPLLVNNREITHGQTADVQPNDTITVCSYILRIQPVQQ